MAKELPGRNEVREEDTWNVADMYPTKEAWEADIEKIKAYACELEKMEGKVAASAENLLFTLKKRAEMLEKTDFAFNNAERLFDEDQKNAEHKAMEDKAYAVYADA